MPQDTLPIIPAFDLKPPRGLMTPRACVRAVLDSADPLTYGVEDWATEYAEPGYDAPKAGILFGNWNDKTQYDTTTRTFRTLDTRPSRFAKIAEAAGYTCEWYDEWATCDDCYKAVRTSPDSYGWRRSYAILERDSAFLCAECVKADPAAYLEELLDNPRRADTLDLDLAGFGFTKYNGTYENGMHPGQTDDPTKITADIRAAHGPVEIVFQIPAVGQFDIEFTAWYRPRQEAEE